ncbi:hypothetical protein B0H11DRAFT_1033687 [Mycena galericulata]|nr:hypothetical protein B0H11DRAFT_1033687 [Mycena galericulata]
MLALLLTVLGLALPVLAYLWNRASPSPPLFPKHAQKSHKLSVASSSSDDSDSDNMPKATPRPPDPVASPSHPESADLEIPTELENQPTQVVVRGPHDRAVRPLPQNTNRAPAARADLPTDGGMDISPQERRMLDAMATASSEMFQYIRTRMWRLVSSSHL